MKAFISDSKDPYDTTMASETWLKESDTLVFENYDIIRCDRQNRGGGSLIMVRKSLSASHLTIESPKLESIEVAVNDIISKHEKLRLVTFYSPANCTIAQCDELMQMLRSLTNVNHKLLIVSDLNFPCISWSNGCVGGKSDNADTLFEELCSLGLHQLINEKPIPLEIF